LSTIAVIPDYSIHTEDQGTDQETAQEDFASDHWVPKDVQHQEDHAHSVHRCTLAPTPQLPIPISTTGLSPRSRPGQTSGTPGSVWRQLLSVGCRGVQIPSTSP
jgi:hypothetical protein